MSFVSCGNDNSLWPTDSQMSSSIEPAQAEMYSYEFYGSKCSTELQSFETFERACEALKNDELNNNCANNKREELFISSACEGSFT